MSKFTNTKTLNIKGAFEQALKEGIEKKKKKDREKLEEAGGTSGAVQAPEAKEG